jgi:Clp amino terminal domain, pathogenicity island component
MHYKGEDLDLRVPYTRGGRDRLASDREPAGRWPRLASTSLADVPMWVDEVVLQCCNYAFEVAAAHHAGEVGLEHLLHALTRVDAAARVLELRGVREAQLRRESGSLLATEIAPVAGGEAAPPRRSLDLEEVLRRAVERAQRRGYAAGIDDLLWSLLHFPAESAAIALLRRMTPDWQRSDWTRQAASMTSDPRLMEQARSAFPIQRDIPPARLADLEDAIHHVHVELTSERRAFLDLIRDLHRDVLSQRGDQASFRGDMVSRLDAIERALEVRSESPRSPVVAERMQALEKAVHAGLGEGARNWAALGQKMQAFDRLAEQLETIGRDLGKRADDGSPLSERLEGLERAMRSGFGESVRLATQMGTRLEAVDTATNQQKASGEEALLMLDERLANLERLIAERQPQAGNGLATQILERITGLEARFANQFQPMADQVVKLTAPIGDRVSGLEQQITKRSEETLALLRETSRHLLEREKALSVAGENAEAELQARDREVRELHDAIVRLAENQHTLASAVSDWRHEVQSDLGTINACIEKLVNVVTPPIPEPAPRPSLPRTRRTPAATKPPPLPSDAPTSRLARWRLGAVRTWLHPSERLTRVNHEARQRLKRLQQQIRAVRLRRR